MIVLCFYCFIAKQPIPGSEAMHIGYARVSTQDQNWVAQVKEHLGHPDHLAVQVHS
jgi:hypothetical protein